MKIGLRGGHSPNCIGAVGYLNEYVECQKLYQRTAELLQSKGHTIVNCNSNGYSAGAELSEGTNKANSNKVDIFVSIHMNAGGGTGCEVWCYNNNSGMAISYGQIICKNISRNLGIENRGIKFNSTFHDLRCTNMDAMIIETLFCDNKNDTNKFDVEKTARAIANAFDSSITLTSSEPKQEERRYTMDGIVIYSNDVDRRAGEYLADALKLPTIYSGISYDYSRINPDRIYAVGGNASTYTSYLKPENLISGKDRYDTMILVLKKIGRL